MTISETQNLIDDWIKKYGVRYFHELTNLGILMEEVGELSRHMVREFGEQSYKNPEERNTALKSIEDEMADIIFVLICLSNQMGINLEEAIKSNIEKKTKRDIDRHQSNEKLK